MQRPVVIGRVAAWLAVIAFITAVYTLALHVNPTTVALTYLVAILLISSSWSIADAMAASFVAMLCFNFFFLPPVGTFTIADPQNWVALVAFLITAVVTSQLSGRARRREIEALSRQRDLERLYALSRSLLLSERNESMPGEIARHVAGAFEVESVAVFDLRRDLIGWGGRTKVHEIEPLLRDTARRGVSMFGPAGMSVIAIRLGGAPIGSLSIAGIGLTDTVMQSIANLAAIGLEKARAAEATVRADAARESSELRAIVLDALAHEFKTPLTAMKAASSDLRSRETAPARDRELGAIIDEEVDRLGALVTDAIQMLRIDSGDFSMHPSRHAVAALIESVVQQFEPRLDGHRVIERVPADLTVDADRELLVLAIRQLLDNAVKYSTPSSTIDVAASGNGLVEITIHNAGSTIPERDQARIFERFYRGAHARHIPGSGMGLAIVQQIAQAHGGSLSVSSQPDTGTTFALSLPRGGSKA